jgi:hypothetical protein
MRDPSRVSPRDRLPLAGRIRLGALELLHAAGVPFSFRHALELFRGQRRLARPAGGKNDGPRVLVVSLRGAWLLHGTWEALIAEALRRRGARPELFVCSGGLPPALPGKSPACGIANAVFPAASCRSCRSCALAMADAFRLPAWRLDDFVSPDCARDLMARIDALHDEGVRRLEHRGFPLGQYVLNSARWFLCVSNLDVAPESRAVVRAFAKSALVVAEAAGSLFDRCRPEVVFMVNGLFFAERILRAEADRRGIRTVTYERGYVPDTLCFSDREVANFYDISPYWAAVADLPLTPAQEARLDEYLAERRRGRQAPFNYWPVLTESEKELLAGLGLDPARPMVSLYTNIPWDSAAQDRDRAFSNMQEWVSASISLFSDRPDVQLVIRIHPAEVRVPGWESRDPVLKLIERAFPALPPNVRVVPPESSFSSYTLMSLSRCGLVYTSTIGLEMAMDGIPVVTAGQVAYAGKGFTLDPATPEEYERVVEEALSRPRDEQVRTRARRYGYALFFRNFLSFPLVAESPPDFVPRLRTADPSVLDPGEDTTLDIICRGILERGPFFATS